MNIAKLHLANLVGKVMEENVKLQIFLALENNTKRSNSMVFDFEKIMDFAMDIDKLNLANLVGKVDFFVKVYRNIKARDLQ